MAIPENLFEISKINGVDQYIILDHRGEIAGHDIEEPGNAAKMVFTCGRNIQAIGKSKFEYAIFSRNNKKNIIIIPVGNFFLGVVKKQDCSTLDLVEALLRNIRGAIEE